MLAGILIIAFSLALLVYWFRYSCVLILRNREVELQPAPDLVDSRFTFIQVRDSIESAHELDPLQNALDRDYRVLTYLLEHAAGLELATLEDRLLRLDYRIMQCAYRITRTAAPAQARSALNEMATVLSILVQRLGEQAGAAAEA
jgi:hypothetical protein